MPAPVMARNTAKDQKSHDKAGGDGGQKVDQHRDGKQLLAPEPVRQPAEEQRADHRSGQIGAGSDPDLAAGELQASDSSAIAADSDPTSVTSSPSRIHVIPSAQTTSQWNRLHGSRSSRAGTSVSNTAS